MIIYKINNFISKYSGVTAIEYALLGGLIAVVIVFAVTAVGVEVVTLFESIADAFS